MGAAKTSHDGPAVTCERAKDRVWFAPMLIVACLEMTSGERGVSSDGLSFDRSCQTHMITVSTTYFI